MPTIQQLPAAESVSSEDAVPISQGGIARSVAVGTLLAGMQPAIIAPSGSLMGRISPGPGGPEAINIGSGLIVDGGTLSVAAADPPPQTTSIAASDLVCINRSGTQQTISYAEFLDGLTIDAAQPARPASDTDTLWTAQGSSIMLRQNFAAIWAWLASKFPSYKMPVVEITVDTTLDGTVHNGRLLVCTQPVAFNPAFNNMGSGFTCEVVNVSSGNVTFGSGILTPSGAPVLPSGQMAIIRGASFSSGTVVIASAIGPTASPSAAVPPGSVVGLAGTSSSSSSVALTWSPPISGGPVSAYIVEYCVSGTSAWNTASTSNLTTSFIVAQLAAGTSYDFRVSANGPGGLGPATVTTITTSAAPSSGGSSGNSGSTGSSGNNSGSSGSSGTSTGSGNSVASITWNVIPSGTYTAGSGSIGVNAHVSPASAPIQFGFSASTQTRPSVWTGGLQVNTDLWGAYVPVPPTAGNWYVWAEGTDGSCPTVNPTPFTVT